MSSPRQTLRTNLLFVLAACLVALLLCEAVLRLSGYRPALTDRSMYVANPSRLLPYKLRSGYHGVYLGQVVDIDADGHRIMRPNLAIRPPGPVARVVLLLGDSVVFGHGLASEATLGAQLQNALWSQGRRDEVRSIGVAGYTSWNEYAAVDEYLRQQRADLIIVIYVANDVSVDDDQLGIGRGAYATQGDGWLHDLAQEIYRHAHVVYLGVDQARRLLGWLDADRRGAVGIPLDEAALRHSLEGLERLASLCRERDIDLRVGVYRDLSYQDDPEASRRYEETIAGSLAARGIASFTIGSHVEHLARAEARRAWNDAHPSAAAIGFMVTDILRAVDAANPNRPKSEP